MPNTLTEDDYVTLGEASHMYSGSDIKNVAKEALMLPVRKCQNATRWKLLPSGDWTPTSPSDPDPNCKDMGIYDLPAMI